MLNVLIRNKILSYITGKAKTITLSNGTGKCYLGLSTTTPNSDGTNFTEPSASSYARVQLNIMDAQQWTDKWGTVDNGAVTNKDEITTHECTEEEGWGTLTHFGIFDSLIGGTPLAFDLLTDPDGEPDEDGIYPAKALEITKNKVVVFRVGTLQLKLV